MKAGVIFALAVGLCVVLFCATVLRFGWNLLIRPVFYAAGWVPPTAHDLEVEGWKAERVGDQELAISRYAEALRLDPANEAVRDRLRALGADELLERLLPEPPITPTEVAASEPVGTAEPESTASLPEPLAAVPTRDPDPPPGPGEPVSYPPGWTAERVRAFVASKIDTGASRSEIAEQLTQAGFAREEAAAAVAAAARARSAALDEAGRKNMRNGALWFGGGLLVTVLSYQAAGEGGGAFVLAWGAMLAGVIQFFRGTTQRGA